ncbi:MAG: hypothetical protein A3J29_16595 [Acidobacteria bacterium RIFCSPLOWO2_12_FULL_67_14b]|nr:MAG: hypothetical protein A3J29_16595 [Acidobacteria bacterium RIFCSPLOWO2_12_FULL_67_14b]
MQPPPPPLPPQPDAITPTIVHIITDKPAPDLSMIDVAVAAFGLIGVIMAAAVVAGLLAGGLFIWYRSRRPITIIEARGGQHNLFRT